jgi:hypothetical protein
MAMLSYLFEDLQADRRCATTAAIPLPWLDAKKRERHEAASGCRQCVGLVVRETSKLTCCAEFRETRVLFCDRLIAALRHRE